MDTEHTGFWFSIVKSACDSRKERNDPVTRNAERSRRALRTSHFLDNAVVCSSGGGLRSAGTGQVERKQTRRKPRRGKKVGRSGSTAKP